MIPSGAWGSLSDIRVIDLTQMLAGPYSTMMLADHGAEVVKVEAPGGDMARSGGPFLSEDHDRSFGGYFQSINRNKQSVCLDLKTPEGVAAMKALIKDADAVVENFRGGVMDRLGLGYEVLRELNPRLVYGAIRGFGDARTGRPSPYVDWPAFDVVAQAMGGLMAITGPDADTPTKIGPGVGDIIPGMMLAFGLLAAIHHARRTGQGQFVDVSMVDSIFAVCERTVWQNSIQNFVPGPEGNHHPFLTPFGIFPASDGWVTIAAQDDAFFTVLCEALDLPALATDERFLDRAQRGKNRQLLINTLSDVTRTLAKADLTARLGGKIPFGPVMGIGEIVEDDHFAARDMIATVEQGPLAFKVAGVPIKLTDTPGGVRRRAPAIGEHTRRELTRAGLTDDEIDHILAHAASKAKTKKD
ncbi:CoA transferase [Brevundimonas sp.]|uniref:CaiB/BaiF CoA transferase family protein n=1 Tax=Brevundimonas sp. TaxID=1871086 RepID=UPI00289C1E83|nr:CoA transferase [Brevundimonas sp.]